MNFFRNRDKKFRAKMSPLWKEVDARISLRLSLGLKPYRPCGIVLQESIADYSVIQFLVFFCLLRKPKLGFFAFLRIFYNISWFCGCFCPVFLLLSSKCWRNISFPKILQQMSTNTIPFLGLFCKYPEKVQLFFKIIQIQFRLICRVVAHRGD